MADGTLKERVYGKLRAVCGEKVCYFYPKSFRELPVISYYEVYAAPSAAADDQAYLDVIEVMVDIWAKGPAEIAAMDREVKAAMTGLGFRWIFGGDAFEKEPGIYRRANRFRVYE